jgi:hypothetical protein
MNKFKIGDKVKILKNSKKEIRCHQEAIIVDIDEHGSYLDFGKDIGGHSCNHKCKDGYGWYFSFGMFEKAAEDLEWDK